MMQGEEYSCITDNTYSKRDILRMEETIWGALNFELSVPTPRTFLRSFIQASAADWPPLSIWRYGLVPRLHPNADRDCPGCHTTSGISCAVSSAVSAQPSGPDM